MGNKIRTEADRKATPPTKTAIGLSYSPGKGQRVSRERGSHINHKKNPGKRAHKGGS